MPIVHVSIRLDNAYQFCMNLKSVIAHTNVACQTRNARENRDGNIVFMEFVFCSPVFIRIITMITVDVRLSRSS